MTKDEAIEVLIANYPSSCYGKLREAVDEAIESLETDVSNAQNTLNALDCISRQDAIDALEREKTNENRPTAERLWANLGLEIGCEKLKTLPSAQPTQSKALPTVDVPDRKVGKWIKEVGMLMCSECGDAWGTEQFDEVMSFNFCPNCGAKMEAER